MKSISKKIPSADFATTVGNALKRSAKSARKTAKMYGTPIYIWKDGKVIAMKP